MCDLFTFRRLAQGQYSPCQKNTMLLIVLRYISNGKPSADIILAQRLESFLGRQRALDSSGVSKCISKKVLGSSQFPTGQFFHPDASVIRGPAKLIMISHSLIPAHSKSWHPPLITDTCKVKRNESEWRMVAYVAIRPPSDANNLMGWGFFFFWAISKCKATATIVLFIRAVFPLRLAVHASGQRLF